MVVVAVVVLKVLQAILSSCLRSRTRGYTQKRSYPESETRSNSATNVWMINKNKESLKIRLKYKFWRKNPNLAKKKKICCSRFATVAHHFPIPLISCVFLSHSHRQHVRPHHTHKPLSDSSFIATPHSTSCSRYTQHLSSALFQTIIFVLLPFTNFKTL